MLNNGAANLYASMERINALNVFPVADGDTGTNMYLTLENGLRRAQSCREIGPYLRSLSEGMLLGARGNSGVILSQLFRGIAQELARCSAAGPGEWRNAWIRGYRTAYNSVVCPVEGTILTVAREGIEHKERRREQDKFTSLTTESIRGIREIKTLGIKNNLINNMIDIIKEIYNKSSREIDIQKSFNIKTRLLKSILECLVFATCIVLLYNKASLRQVLDWSTFIKSNDADAVPSCFFAHSLFSFCVTSSTMR